MVRDGRRSDAEALREIVAGSFIFELPGALPREVCREMVRRFEACAPEHYAGRVGHHAALDPSVKRSTDLVMSGKSHWKDLDTALFRSLVPALDAVVRTNGRPVPGTRVRSFSRIACGTGAVRRRVAPPPRAPMRARRPT